MNNKHLAEQKQIVTSNDKFHPVDSAWFRASVLVDSFLGFDHPYLKINNYVNCSSLLPRYPSLIVKLRLPISDLIIGKLRSSG